MMHKGNDVVVSICTQAFNHGKYIQQCLDGFLNQQTDFRFEILVLDDASTDDTADIIRHYEVRYPDVIKAVYESSNQHSLGVNTLTRKLFKQAKGKYIAICEGDDYWIDETKLQQQVNFMEANAGASMCFTNVQVFDDDLQQIQPYWAIIQDKNYSIQDLIKGNVAPMCSVVFRNHLIDFTQHTFEGIPMGDWPIYIFLLRDGYAKYLDFISAVYRVRNAGMFSKNSVEIYLNKKKQIFEFLLQNTALTIYHKDIYKEYYRNLYALSIRLPTDNPDKKKYLKSIIGQMLNGNAALSFKALVRYFA